MRPRLSTRYRLIVGLASVVILGGATVAWADPCGGVHCVNPDPLTSDCYVEAVDTCDPDGPGTGTANDQPGGGSTQSGSGLSGGRTENVPIDDKPRDTSDGIPCYWERLNSRPAAYFPTECYSESGYPWSNDLQCYVREANPQPPASAPVWEGRNPDDGGAIYDCLNRFESFIGDIWLAEPPTPAAGGPTPGEVARMAVERMNLRAITIGIAPEPGGVGVTGMPTWLWIDGPGPATFGPITETATAGGVRVTATAEVHRIVWNMGDGTEVVCRSAVTPYESRYGTAASPDCGHTYTRDSGNQPKGTYIVSATSEWVVQWEGAGQTGTITLDDLFHHAQRLIRQRDDEHHDIGVR
jgi:hypothetical protein